MAGSVLPAELLHRYFDVRGKENIFVCGGDVHGTPLELEALERGEDPRDIKDEQTKKVREAYESLNVDFTIFSDTHSEYNRKQTHDMFEELYCNGLIDEKTQTMPYCNDDERFLPDRYIEGECPHCGGLARGDQCDDCGKLVEPDEIENPECQICGGNDIEFKDTDHLFLNLTEYKEDLKQWIKDREPVPDNMVNQVLHDIEEAEERSITRDQDWGFEIPVERVNEKIEEEDLEIEKLDPERYDEKVLYVWFDAPIGYIGFTREYFEDSDEWKKHWNQDADIYYSIGKDNTIFHTVIWPTMLLGSRNDEIEYGLPEYEFIQQYLMWEEGAFSKSRNRGIFIDEAVEHYPADYWRFYLSKMLPTDHDTNFSWDDFESEINNVLNDTVGNFVNRTLSLAEKWFDNEVPEVNLTTKDEEVVEDAEEAVKEYIEAFDEKEPQEALDHALELARLGDQYLSSEEPWNNEDRRAETIHVSLQLIQKLGVTLHPFIPESGEKIFDMLNTDIKPSGEEDLLGKDVLGGLETGQKLGDREILFEKIDVSEQKEEKQENKEDTMTDKFNEDTVSFDQFGDMDLRIGKVESVEEHPNADKLYKVKVNVGEATLQTCAGLKNFYEPEELEDRKVVVLANLEPAELRGEKSECMMLAAESDDGETVSLLDTDKEMEVGDKIK
ncbi:MAG: methionyl-tRNA synthetase [Candidatus Nanohaloarchaea archaeon]|jgi:methionyl-tRNA synthetase